MYCHPASPEDATIAPYLGRVSDRHGRAGLAASVMHRKVDPAWRFEIHWFDMKDGTRYEGTVIREDGDILEISDEAGTVSFLHKDRIAARGTYEESHTPRGLVDFMTLDELAALVAYLESLDSGGGGS
jgi:putative heme-binding domain-containing protein